MFNCQKKKSTKKFRNVFGYCIRCSIAIKKTQQVALVSPVVHKSIGIAQVMYTYFWELRKSVGSNGSYSAPFMMNVMGLILTLWLHSFLLRLLWFVQKKHSSVWLPYMFFWSFSVQLKGDYITISFGPIIIPDIQAGMVSRSKVMYLSCWLDELVLLT